jgi:hypothetical protein
VGGGRDLDVAVALHAFEERQVHVGAMAHGVGIGKAAAESLAYRHRGHFGFVHRIHHHEMVGVHRLRASALADAERVEGRERIGAQLDAGADLADLRRLLEDLHRVAPPRERERGGEPADAAAGDENGMVGIGARHG